MIQEDLRIRYVTDGWTGVLLIDDNPVYIHWNSRSMGGPSFNKVIGGSTLVESFFADLADERRLMINGKVEKIVAKAVRTKYEFYFDPTQRYYSTFVRVFNRYNNEYISIPTRDKEFYNTDVRLLNWQYGFIATREDFDIGQIRDVEIRLKAGQRPFVTLYQHYIAQNGVGSDGYRWHSSHVSPFFIVDANYICQAYRNLNIPPNFILYTEKVRGDGQSEFKGNEELIDRLLQQSFNEEELSLVKKYRR
jgi:hypothetical protein